LNLRQVKKLGLKIPALRLKNAASAVKDFDLIALKN
jgi:hypothetical protein